MQVQPIDCDMQILSVNLLGTRDVEADCEAAAVVEVSVGWRVTTAGAGTTCTGLDVPLRSVQVKREVRRLQRNGVTSIGDRDVPRTSVSLTDAPACRRHLRRVIGRGWGWFR